jgi:hypothetical protein
MTKATDIEDILKTRDRELMLDALWDDPAIVGKIRATLEKVTATNLKYYKSHFCGELVEVKK